MEDYIKNIMQENLEMMKMILVGLRREIVSNMILIQKTSSKEINRSPGYNQYLKSVEDYMGCMRDARKLGISLKEIVTLYNDIDEVMEFKRKTGQSESLIFKFNSKDKSQLN